MHFALYISKYVYMYQLLFALLLLRFCTSLSILIYSFFAVILFFCHCTNALEWSVPFAIALPHFQSSFFKYSARLCVCLVQASDSLHPDATPKTTESGLKIKQRSTNTSCVVGGEKPLIPSIMLLLPKDTPGMAKGNDSITRGRSLKKLMLNVSLILTLSCALGLLYFSSLCFRGWVTAGLPVRKMYVTFGFPLLRAPTHLIESQ